MPTSDLEGLVTVLGNRLDSAKVLLAASLLLLPRLVTTLRAGWKHWYAAVAKRELVATPVAHIDT